MSGAGPTAAFHFRCITPLTHVASYPGAGSKWEHTVGLNHAFERRIHFHSSAGTQETLENESLKKKKEGKKKFHISELGADFTYQWDRQSVAGFPKH